MARSAGENDRATRIRAYRTKKGVWGFGFSRRDVRWYVRCGRWVITNNIAPIRANWFLARKRKRTATEG